MLFNFNNLALVDWNKQMTNLTFLKLGMVLLLVSCAPETATQIDGESTVAEDKTKETTIPDTHNETVIYKNSKPLSKPYKVKLDEVKIVGDFDDFLTVDFVYTYKHDIPPEEVRLYVTPDHKYWRVSHVKVNEGTHEARTIIRLSKDRMKSDGKTQSDTTKLNFRFDHYPSDKQTGKIKYEGNLWAQVVKYKKRWKPQ